MGFAIWQSLRLLVPRCAVPHQAARCLRLSTWGSPDRHGALLRQDDTPKPTNPDVYIHGTPSATFFVSQYAGFGQDDITVSLKVPPCALLRWPCSPCAANLLPCAWQRFCILHGL